MVEYAVILLILFPIFLLGGVLLTRAALKRGGESINTVNSVVPCGPKMGGSSGNERCL